GAMIADRAGPFGLSMSARAFGSVAAVGEGEGADGVAIARARASLPLVRAYASAEEHDPWLHRVEPGVAAAILATRGSEITGALQGVNVGFPLAERDDVDPVVARVLTDAPLEPSGGFLSATGWTGGARIAIPWSAYVVTRAGADADLTTSDLVAARASFELRD